MGRKMVFNSLLESAFYNAGNISSSDPAPRLSLTMLLETFVPGYGLIHKFLLFAFGFDVTIFVSLYAVLWLGIRIFHSVWPVIGNLVYNNCMSEVTIDKQDEIYDHMMAFLAHQYKFESSRRLTVETISKSAWELDSENMETRKSKGGEGTIKLLNFANQEAKSQPRFTPAIGSHHFWHKGRYFQLRRKEVTFLDEVTFKDKELLTLSCLGRSAGPIKKLIQDAKNHYYRRQKVTTVIKRPGPKEMRRFGRGGWVKIAERPCRPMETVVLDKVKKDDIVDDINEYLNPTTARWYANRGIPYRRGYLFHGPPGTGKTSLTFALAGLFGLDIHVVSLQEPTLTEEELGMLFTHLPARCIVLLEDIDTAGLIRERTENNEKTAPTAGDQSGNSDFNVLDLAKALKKANQLSEEEKRKGITLAGLLNIIDGVASHEGRVLVMTTNHPEKLDDALVRPGRVDKQVEFEYTTRKETRSMFERMYTNDLPRTDTSSTTKAEENPMANETANGPPNTRAALNSVVEHSEEEKTKEKSDKLSLAAKDFAKKVPDGVFSPAEIQGFLLKRKNDPGKALNEVGPWVESMKEVKEKRSKLLQVQ